MAQIDIGKTHSMYLYDADTVDLNINNQLMWGFQDGDMASGQKTNANMTFQEDPKGNVAGARIHTSLGTLTVTLVDGSPCNKILQDLLDKGTQFPAMVTDSSTGEEFGGQHCFINKEPDVTKGKAVGNRVWTINVADYTHDYNAA